MIIHALLCFEEGHCSALFVFQLLAVGSVSLSSLMIHGSTLALVLVGLEASLRARRELCQWNLKVNITKSENSLVQYGPCA